jgi:hypothetical protein
MKRLLCGLLTAPVVVLMGCSPTALQPGPEEYHPPIEVEEKLNRDALASAFEYLMRTDSAFIQDSVTITPFLIKKIKGAMAAVWRSSSLERDSVIEIYHVTPHHLIDYHEVTVAPGIDASKYSSLLLVNALYPTATSKGLATRLRSRVPCNTIALSNRIVNSVLPSDYIQVFPSWKVADGHRVRASLGDEVIRLDYEMRYGDCMVGCTLSRIWTFEISSDSVRFIGVRGDPPCTPPCW